MSSKRRIRRNACTGKQRHASEQAAWSALSALRRDKGYDGVMHPYRCRFCNAFHIGHPPRRVRQAMRDRRLGL